MPEHCKPSTVRTTVRAMYIFSDELPPGCPPIDLPDGCMMMEVELDDLTLLVLRPGSMDRRLKDQLNAYADRVTSLGIWRRDSSRQELAQAAACTASR